MEWQTRSSGNKVDLSLNRPIADWNADPIRLFASCAAVPSQSADRPRCQAVTFRPATGCRHISPRTFTTFAPSQLPLLNF